MTPNDAAPPEGTLRAAIERRTIDELKPLAKHFVSRVPVRKVDLVELLVKQLEGDGLRAVWDQLTEVQKIAVAETVHDPDGRFDAVRFEAKYGQLPWAEPVSGYGRVRAGLLDLFLHDGVIPEDLRGRLLAFVAAPSRPMIESTPDVPAQVEREWNDWDAKAKKSMPRVERLPVVVREMERAAALDLQAMLRLVEAGRVAASAATGRASGAAVKEIEAILDGGDFYAPGADEGPFRAFAWPLLLQAARLARVTNGRLQLTRDGSAALGAQGTETLHRIWQSWLKSDLLDEFARIDVVKGQGGRRARMTKVDERRQAIADALAECPVGRWIPVDMFFRHMRATAHNISVAQDNWGLYVVDAEYGSMGYAGHGEWEILEGRYVLALLFEYAATLGMIDVAYIPAEWGRTDWHDIWGMDSNKFFSRYDGLLSFRLTPLGAHLLDVTETYVAPERDLTRPLKILPTLEVIMGSGALPSAEVLLLEKFTRKTGDRVWKIDRERVLEALEEGGSVAELLALLRSRSELDLPDDVERILREIEERATQVRNMGGGILVECVDEALAALLGHDTRTRPSCRPVGGRYLFVPSARDGAFRRGLRLLGYSLPRAFHEPR